MVRFSRLIARSLLFYRATGLAVAAGVAVATAVIAGSLIVGDSVRGSVRDTVLGRLGRIDHAVTAPHFFREQLASDIMNATSQDAAGGTQRIVRDDLRRVVPVTLGQGAARNVQTNATVPSVSVIGADAAFWQFFPAEGHPDLAGREVALNESAARDLGVAPDDFILLNVQRRARAPSDTLFARHAREDVLRSMRLKVKAVLPDAGAAGFSLLSQTQTPRNVFVAKEWLAKELDAQGLANTLLVESARQRETDSTSGLRRALESALTLADAGLKLDTGSGCLWLKSRSLTVPISAEAAESEAKAAGARAYPVSVYLATTIARQGGGELAYAVMAAIDPVPDGFFGEQVELGGDAILLNSWAAEDLGAKTGDRLDVSYFLPSRDGVFRTQRKTFTVRAIIPMDGRAGDPALVPEFEGITETETIADWKPPFPVELNRVTARDDDYWRRYRALPKAWIPMRQMEEIWSAGRSGERVDYITSIRFEPAGGELSPTSLRRASRAARSIRSQCCPCCEWRSKPLRAPPISACCSRR